jgi:hypothetical protein
MENLKKWWTCDWANDALVESKPDLVTYMCNMCCDSGPAINEGLKNKDMNIC